MCFCAHVLSALSPIASTPAAMTVQITCGGAAGSYQDIVKQLDVSIINTTAINLTARISLAGGREFAPATLTTPTRLAFSLIERVSGAPAGIPVGCHSEAVKYTPSTGAVIFVNEQNPSDCLCV